MSVPLLVFAWGNPSRGDDALGPALAEAAAGRLARELQAGRVELLSDFQLQVEHALDLEGRDQVIFVDASLACAAPYEYAPVHAAQDASFTSHVLSPAAVLHTYRQVQGREPPPAWLLSIRGYAFELGAPLSAGAQANLAQALDFLTREVCGGVPG